MKSLGKKAITGATVLASRTVALQLVNFVGYFVLTIFLSTKDFGTFIIVSALIDIAGYFSDIGLAAALIQSKKEPEEKEIWATFNLQAILVLTLVLIISAVSGKIKRIYNLDIEGYRLLLVFLASLFISSLKTVPSVLLERKLEFKKIIIPQIVEALVFNSIVILLVWKGWGLRSYTVAVLARSIVGTLLMYLINPVKIKLYLSFKPLKRLLKFGLPFQANSLLAVAKDKLLILLLASILGVEGVGLIGWAEKWANLGLRYVLDPMLKVAFPLFARIQNDYKKLRQALEKSLYFLTLFVYPMLAGSGFVIYKMVNIWPKYQKWQPAVTALVIYIVSAFFASFSTLLTNLLMAIGQVKDVLKLMVFWTLLSWGIMPLLSMKLGIEGAALGSMIISLSWPLPYWLSKRQIRFSLFSQIIPNFVCTLIMSIGLYLSSPYLGESTADLFIIVILGSCFYFLCQVILFRKKFLSNINYLKQYVVT